MNSDVTAKRAVQAKLRPLVQPHVHALHASKKTKKKLPPAIVSKLAMKDSLRTEEGAKRWWASIPCDVEFIRKWSPPIGHVTVANANGRFLAYYPGHHRMSCSWTKRGMEAASTSILRAIWSLHTNATFEECPLPF